VPDQQFFIQREVFEISSSLPARVYELQNRISQLSGSRLTRLMEDFFNSNIPPDLVCRVDSITLDLGEVQYDTLEQEIEERFLDELGSAFAKKNADSTRNELPLIPGLETATLLTGKIRLLEYFLLNGTLPWWALPGDDNDPVVLISKLAATEAASLHGLLLRIGSQDQVIRRMVYQFPDEQILQIAAIAEPAGADFISRYFIRVMEFKQEAKQIQADKEDFRNSVWEFILKFLFQEKESIFSEKMFLKQNLMQLAGHYNVSFRDLLIHFHHSAGNALTSTAQHLLLTLLEDIYEEESPQHETIPAHPDPGTSLAQNPDDLLLQLEAIDYYLLYDALPRALWGYSASRVRSVLFELLHTIPGSVRKRFSAGNRGNGYYQRLYQLAGPEHTGELLLSLFPGFSSLAAELERTLALLGQATAQAHYSPAEAGALFWKPLYSAFAASGMHMPATNTLIQRVLTGLTGKGNRSFPDQRVELSAMIRAALLAKGGEYPLLGDFENNLALADETVISPSYIADDPPEENQPATLRNLLAFLLRYGSIPWWGRAVSINAIPDFMEELYRKDREGLLILFRRSLGDRKMRARFFEHLDPAIIEQLLHRFPSGDKAAAAFRYFIRVAGQAGIFAYHDSLFINKTFVRIAAELLYREGFSFFPDRDFFTRAFVTTSEMLNQPLLELAKLVQDSRKVRTAAMIEADKELEMIRALYGLLMMTDKEENRVFTQDLLSAIADEHIPPVNIPVADDDAGNFILHRYFNLEGMSRDQQILEISAVLEYFLTWNQLPARFMAPDALELKVLMQQVLFFLYQADRDRLRTVLGKPGDNDSPYLYLYELVQASGGEREKELKHFLLDVRVAQKEVAATKEQDSSENAGITETLAAAGAIQEAFALDLLDPAGKGEEEVKRRSREWFRYYLFYGRFPDEFGAYDAGKAGRLLEWIISFLFTDDRDFLAIAIADPANKADSRLQVVDRFVSGYDLLSSRIALFFDPFREEIIKSFPTGPEEPVTKDPGSTSTDAKAIRLNRSPSYAKWVLEKHGAIPFLLLVAGKMGSKEEQDHVVLRIHRVMQRIAGEYEEASRLPAWFFDYNLLIYSSNETPIGEETYGRNLLRFLAERGGRKTLKIMEAFLEAAGKEDRLDPGGSKGSAAMLRSLLPGERMLFEERRKVSELLQDKERAEAFGSIQEKKDIYRKKIKMEIKKELSAEPGADQNELPQPDEETPGLPGDNLYISNAGLILFHPFLVTFLERVGLLVERKFPEPKAANRAVLLLQYLASGSEESLESDLVLNKILCGLPVQEPVPLRFVPTEDEIRIAEELFEVLAERWSQIGNTSVEGIRNSFIMRKGMLSFTDDGWKMRVEQRGYDILLQTLPWAFGIVKTPMMEKALLTEWI